VPKSLKNRIISKRNKHNILGEILIDELESLKLIDHQENNSDSE